MTLGPNSGRGHLILFRLFLCQNGSDPIVLMPSQRKLWETVLGR
jgi:hypothetical protein